MVWVGGGGGFWVLGWVWGAGGRCWGWGRWQVCVCLGPSLPTPRGYRPEGGLRGGRRCVWVDTPAPPWYPARILRAL